LEVGQPRAYGNLVDDFNPQRASTGKDKCTGESFSLYGFNDFRAKIELFSCRLYNGGGFQAVIQLNWNEIIDKEHDDENWVDP
jgi:hypothetical protein